MNNQEAADELQYAIDLIKQDGKDWLDERDIPILEAAISALQAQEEEQREEQLYCDRNICLRNEYNGIGCEECEVTKSQQQAKHGDGLDETIRRLENISEYQSAEAERWDHSFDDYSGVKRDEYLKWSDEHRQLASWLKELKRLRTEVYFLKAEKENEPVDLLGDVPCKTCKWRVTTTEKCEECIDGVSDNYEVQEPCEDAVSREAVTDIIRHSDIFSTWYEMDDTDDIVAEVIDEARKQLVDDVNELPSVTPKCPECDDAVSREAAIDAAENAFVRGLLASPDIRKLPSVQPKIEERKEESAQNVPKEDLISRNAAIDRINKQREHLQPDIYPQDKIGDAAYRICAEFIERLPSAQPELSDAVYQLWKRAYEAGERSAQYEVIKCEDCKHRGDKPIADGRYWCDIHDTYMYYCSYAERRTDESDANP